MDDWQRSVMELIPPVKPVLAAPDQIAATFLHA
jgi:hypothetical protein